MRQQSASRVSRLAPSHPNAMPCLSQNMINATNQHLVITFQRVSSASSGSSPQIPAPETCNASMDSGRCCVPFLLASCYDQ